MVTVILESQFEGISRRPLEINEQKGVAVDPKTVMVTEIELTSLNTKTATVTVILRNCFLEICKAASNNFGSNGSVLTCNGLQEDYVMI